MTEHIAFDEFVELIYAEERSERIDLLAAKINSHIFTCAQCREVYSKLLRLKEIVEEEYLSSEACGGTCINRERLSSVLLEQMNKDGLAVAGSSPDDLNEECEKKK